MKFLSAAMVIFLSATAGYGQCYRRSYSYSYPVVQKEIVREVVYPILAYYQVPLYSVAYQPAVYSSQFTSSYQTVAQSAQLYATPVQAAYVAPVVHQSCEEKVATLKLRLEQIEQRLTLAATGPSASPATYQQPEAPPTNGGGVPAGAMSLTNGGHLGVLTAKCVSCHEAGVAANKGGNFLMFQGRDLVAKDPESKARIAASIALGEMPKGGKLTDQEYAAIMQWIKQPSTNGANGHTAPANGHPPVNGQTPVAPPPPPPATPNGNGK